MIEIQVTDNGKRGRPGGQPLFVSGHRFTGGPGHWYLMTSLVPSTVTERILTEGVMLR
jgi:hypothetical protein